MPETDRDALRERLLAQKRELWEGIRREVFHKLGEDHARQFERALDGGDSSVADLLEDTGLSLADLRTDELTRIDETLAKIENGTYGICDDCGEPIGEDRLKVMPYAVYCVRCKERREGPDYPPEHSTI